MPGTLTLSLKAEYFHAIKSGEKTEEFRLVTPYWTKRIEGREYDHLVLTLGYPKRGDEERRIRLPWRGFRKTTRLHKHFGPNPVEVYAIALAEPQGGPNE